MTRQRTLVLSLILLFAAAGSFGAAGATAATSGGPPDSIEAPAHPRAHNLALQWEVNTNLIDDGGRFRSTLTLRNGGDVPLMGEGWTLYFNFLREIDPESVTAPVNIERIKIGRASCRERVYCEV